MKKMKLAALALSLVSVLAAGNALAATTNVTVNANVSEACIATTTQPITIDAIDPTQASGTISSSDKGTPGKIHVRCTAGTDVTFEAPATATLSTGGTDPDTMTIVPIVPSTTEIPGINGSYYDVNASITEIEYKAATAGTYEGSFTVTVTP